MKEICPPDKCTGCSACLDVCPRQSILMQVSDSLGHIYPVINQHSCIDCGTCATVCPVNNPVVKENPITAYAGWDKDVEEYITSTSGGAASAISRHILRMGGVVYGCSMQKGLDVKHLRVADPNSLHYLKGSKYVQSNMGNVYKEILADLKTGKKVLFIGTPCQVAAVKNYTKRLGDDLLYTVDLICHGVPSQCYLKQHVKEILGSTENIIARFRGPEGMQLALAKINADGTEEIVYQSILKKERYKDAYFNAFFDGYTYRPSCRTCQFACKQRVSDVTVGDFWGLGKMIPFEHLHQHGCSVLLPSTPKGEELINGIRNEFHLYERSVDEAVSGNDQLSHPFKQTSRISFFLKIVKYLGVSRAYHISVADIPLRSILFNFRQKIGIVK